MNTWRIKTSAVLMVISMIATPLFACTAVVEKETNDEAYVTPSHTDKIKDDDKAGTSSAPVIIHYVDAKGIRRKMVVDTSLPMHDYDWAYLTNDKKKNIIKYDDKKYTIRKGIDVSRHQGAINWHKVKKAGIKFVFLRLGFRGYGKAGKLVTDSMFRTYLKGAKAAGLDIGVYFFSQAINEKEAREEAKLTLKELGGMKLKLPVVFDPELIPDDDARTDDVSGKQFTDNTIAYLDMIKKAGYDVAVYSNMFWESTIFEMERLTQYPIWYADYRRIPQTPYLFKYWQYSENGRVDGVKGGVDLDVEFIKKTD